MSKNKTINQKNKKNTSKLDLKKAKLNQYIFAFVTVLILAGIAVGLFFLFKKDKGEEEIKRFEDITHISLKQFNALRGMSASDDDFGDLDSNFISETTLFVLVYNPDFDNEVLEELIKQYSENFEFNILVMNYQENEGISDLSDKLRLPEVPALIKISGEDEITEENIYINIREIRTALSVLN